MRTIPLLLVLVAACGSSDDGSGEMTLGGTLQGEVNGNTFSGKYGFAGLHDGDKPIIAIGEANLDCSTDPVHDVHGIGTIITNFDYGVTTPQDNAFIEVFRYTGTHYQLGGSDGAFMLTEVTETTVAGTMDFDYDAGNGDTYSAHGDFILTRCP